MGYTAEIKKGGRRFKIICHPLSFKQFFYFVYKLDFIRRNHLDARKLIFPVTGHINIPPTAFIQILTGYPHPIGAGISVLRVIIAMVPIPWRGILIVCPVFDHDFTFRSSAVNDGGPDNGCTQANGNGFPRPISMPVMIISARKSRVC